MKLKNIADRVYNIKRIIRFLENVIGCKYESIDYKLVKNLTHIPIISPNNILVREFAIHEKGKNVYLEPGCKLDDNSPPFLEFLEKERIIDGSGVKDSVTQAAVIIFYPEWADWRCHVEYDSNFLFINIDSFLKIKTPDIYERSISDLVNYRNVILNNDDRTLIKNVFNKFASLSMLRFNSIIKELREGEVDDSSLYLEALKYVSDKSLHADTCIFADMAGIIVEHGRRLDFGGDRVDVKKLFRSMTGSVSSIHKFDSNRDNYLDNTEEVKAILNYMREKRVANPGNDYVI